MFSLHKAKAMCRVLFHDPLTIHPLNYRLDHPFDKPGIKFRRLISENPEMQIQRLVNNVLRSFAAVLMLMGICATNALADPSGDAAADQLEQAGNLLNKKDYKGALQALNEAIRIDPSWYAPYYYRGTVYEKLGKHKKASADRAKSDVLMKGFIKQKQLSRYFGSLDPAYLTHREHIDDLKARAKSYEDSKQHGKLIFTCTQMIEGGYFPVFARGPIYARRADAYDKLGQHDRAEADRAAAAICARLR